MIVTDLEGFATQASLTPQLRAALDFLRSVRGQQLSDGRIEIDGERAFALVQSYDTLAGGDWTFEGHRRYIDIQYIASGEEIIGWAPAEDASITDPYDAAKERWLGTVPEARATAVRLGAGQLAVLYPSDAHAPKRAWDKPSPVKKIVVKVLV